MRGHFEAVFATIDELDAKDYEAALRIVAVATTGAILDKMDKYGVVSVPLNSLLWSQYKNDPRLNNDITDLALAAAVVGGQLDVNRGDPTLFATGQNYLFCELFDLLLEDTAAYWSNNETILNLLDALLNGADYSNVQLSYMAHGRHGYPIITDLARIWGSLTAQRVSPLVFDLDGDGVETTDVAKQWVMFDMDGDGVKNLTGWAKGDDGFLVFDRNNDGQINDGREMFTNYTKKYDGSGNCADGFEALAQEDTNGDGIVNNQDANWQNLKIWRDLNQNGTTEQGELFTLPM